MVSTVTIRAISLGSFRELDTNESKPGSERASDLVGKSFGSTDAPLADSITKMTLNDGNSDGAVAFGNTKLGSEFIQVNGGSQAVDGGSLYWGNVTYMDGTTAKNVPLRIIQDGSGQLYLLPPPADALKSEISAVTQKPIALIKIGGLSQNNFGSVASSRYGLADPVFLCFRNGTHIMTDTGERPVESLRVGDMVETRDHGLQPIRWIGAKQVDAGLMAAFPKLRPVRIAAGALGAGLPLRDLYVSQQHRILVASKIAERMFGEAEVLVAAKCLIGLDGITVDESEDDLEYFHILFDQHEILLSEGAQTESLFTGPEALRAVSTEARAEILTLFPDLVQSDHRHLPVRKIGSARLGRQLAHRHHINRLGIQATG